jgi:O-antigen ligase
VIANVFPLGVGGDMLRFYMGGDSPSIFEISNPLMLEGYLRVATGAVVTESHNGYIEHIASYGLMGFISILLLIGIITSNLRKAKKKPCIQNNLYSFEISIIVLTGVFYLFLGYPKFYIIIFLMLHLSFLLARENTSNFIMNK